MKIYSHHLLFHIPLLKTYSFLRMIEFSLRSSVIGSYLGSSKISFSLGSSLGFSVIGSSLGTSVVGAFLRFWVLMSSVFFPGIAVKFRQNILYKNHNFLSQSISLAKLFVRLTAECFLPRHCN